MAERVLFIIKKNHASSGYSGGYGNGVDSRKTGLYYSAKYISDMLILSGVSSRVVEVNDNDDIDGAVVRFKPTHVMIEAYWVVPEKFDVLVGLHPDVKWVVRCHSEVTFLAQEEMAIKWTKEYMDYHNVFVASNSLGTVKDLRMVISEAYPQWTRRRINERVFYLPDYYPNCITGRSAMPLDFPERRNYIRVGCFGSVRPLKNQLTQAVAAMTYARACGKSLLFYINAVTEQGGECVLKSLRELFAGTRHSLIEVPWLGHYNFLSVLGAMDVELAASYTETFCLVAADAVSLGVPLVCSNMVPWASRWSVVDPNSVADIVRRIIYVRGIWEDFNSRLNHRNLRKFSKNSERTWLEYLEQ